MTDGPGAAAPIDVLVVDDDVRVARVNAAYVGKVPGFRVTGRAHSAAEALAFLEGGGHADLVLLDHYLPDGTGLALVGQLRRLGHHTDIIMVTAARDIATVQDAMRHGALQYLVKPFTFAGLRAKLTGYAALRRALEGGGEAGQDQVDRIFGALGGASAGPAELPKGHSALTADLVREVLRDAEGPLSAQEVAERSSLSRQTAQRYLKLLERTGRVRLSLKYGETGRPEHRYVWV
ncbi:response regulator [Streptomyces sp. NEAU-Y11]|uniref:response regulator n=1 Tax=Streptomyces cucumeris TaxID=2962890 RepID=UPI0020C90821|nr:response regulator [Streptomyces sp. NEAU-Y11]MCP9205622.1 response regulator [Streptomyces sp. NEAU-Y11]